MTTILKKGDDPARLVKPQAGPSILEVNLKWSTGKPGLFASGNIDLDLACLYELADGSKGVVQALGNDFGSLDQPPFIMLDSDDRRGGSVGGETLRVNLVHSDKFRRLLVFAYIYSGSSNWAKANGVVTMVTPDGQTIQVDLDEPDNRAKTCAVALLTPTPTGLQAQREVQYIHGLHRDLDQAYGWGIPWVDGSK